MDGSEKSAGSWWQTVPGILTALAGIITAVGGLLVVLHQVGLLGNKEKPAAPAASPYDAATRRAEAAAPSAPAKTADASKAAGSRGAKPYTVTFPSGAEVTLHSSRADGIYKILAAQVDNRNTGKLILKVSIRLTNIGRSDLGFWTDSFRLVVDGVPRAPISRLNDSVDARSAKEADVLFEVPDTTENLVLSLANGEDSANIPLVLKKAD
jgi:hypothetical protein